MGRGEAREGDGRADDEQRYDEGGVFMGRMRRTLFLLVVLATATIVAAGTALAAVIEGSAGNDELRGTADADTFNGYGGDDKLFGLGGDDQIDGGEGIDTLYGSDEGLYLSGRDKIEGGPGDDKVFGARDADDLRGGADNDQIYEGPLDDNAVDTINGGPGDDRIYASNGRSAVDSLTCGDGQDEVWVDSSDSVQADCEVVNKDTSRADVAFTTPLSVEQAVGISGRFDAELELVESRYQVAAGQTTDYYVPEGTSPVAIADGLEDNRLGGFEDEIQSISKMKPADQTSQQPKVDAMKAAVAKDDVGAITVSGMTLSGDLQDLRALESEGGSTTETGEAIKTVAIGTPQQLAEESQGMETESAPDQKPMATYAAEEESLLAQFGTPDPDTPMYETQVDADAPPNTSGGTYSPEAGSWWPNSGYSSVGTSQTPGRKFSYQAHKWNNKTGFGGNFYGYEHDFKASRAGGTYLSDDVGFLCFPKGAYARSNYPTLSYPYLDSNAVASTGKCDPYQWAFTIGVYNPSYLRSGFLYNVYFRTNFGGQNPDAVSLYAERTNKIPTGCPPGRLLTFCTTGGAGEVSLPDENTFCRYFNSNKCVKHYSVPSYRGWVE